MQAAGFVAGQYHLVCIIQFILAQYSLLLFSHYLVQITFLEWINYMLLDFSTNMLPNIYELPLCLK